MRECTPHCVPVEAVAVPKATCSLPGYKHCHQPHPLLLLLLLP
jgi:hypothetical protein